MFTYRSKGMNPIICAWECIKYNGINRGGMRRTHLFADDILNNIRLGNGSPVKKHTWHG